MKDIALLMTRQQLDTLTMALNNLRNEVRLEAMCQQLDTDEDRLRRINDDLIGLFNSIAEIK